MGKINIIQYLSYSSIEWDNDGGADDCLGEICGDSQAKIQAPTGREALPESNFDFGSHPLRLENGIATMSLITLRLQVSFRRDEWLSG